MRVAVTGAGGRLGSALVGALTRQKPLSRAVSVEAWSRPALDLDRPETLARLVEARRPDLVLHTAAWTDVDGCARDPEAALLRNGEATRVLARACREAGADLLYVSTNEVFDGRRTDGRPYAEDDPTSPANPYGESKLAGEEAVLGTFAREAVAPLSAHAPLSADEPGVGAATVPQGWVVRTAWLYGPPGDDFPAKILRAAVRADAAAREGTNAAASADAATKADSAVRAKTGGSRLRLVADEVGSPTRAADLAVGIVDLVRARPQTGMFHLVNAGRASRAEWAEEVLRGVGLRVPTERVPASTWERASTPPRWGVLATGRAAQLGIMLRDWRSALFDELPRYRDLAGALESAAAGAADDVTDRGSAAPSTRPAPRSDRGGR